MLYTRDGRTHDVLKLDRKAAPFPLGRMRDGLSGRAERLQPRAARPRPVHGYGGGARQERQAQVEQRTLELFKLVRLDPERVFNSYPHELSGGMRQRTLLALGVLLDPQIVILDEPTTALDILTQRAIIDVLKEMQGRLGFSIIFISHDLALAAEMADRVATTYAGKIVELGGVNDMFYRPLHPYTLGLLRSVPQLNQGEDALGSIPGDPPNLIPPPPGCKFHPRCPFATDQCKTDEPPLVEYAPGHSAACWHTDKVIEARAEFIEAEQN